MDWLPGFPLPPVSLMCDWWLNNLHFTHKLVTVGRDRNILAEIFFYTYIIYIVVNSKFIVNVFLDHFSPWKITKMTNSQTAPVLRVISQPAAQSLMTRETPLPISPHAPQSPPTIAVNLSLPGGSGQPQQGNIVISKSYSVSSWRSSNHICLVDSAITLHRAYLE